MTIPIEFIALFLTVSLAATGALLKYLVSAIGEVNRSLKDIRDHMGSLSGRIGQAETWQLQHERQDDERQEATEREHLRIWARLDHHHN